MDVDSLSEGASVHERVLDAGHRPIDHLLDELPLVLRGEVFRASDVHLMSLRHRLVVGW